MAETAHRDVAKCRGEAGGRDHFPRSACHVPKDGEVDSENNRVRCEQRQTEPPAGQGARKRCCRDRKTMKAKTTLRSRLCTWLSLQPSSHPSPRASPIAATHNSAAPR